MEVLAVLELAVLLAEQPGQHLPGLHAGAHHTPGFVPMSAALAAAAAVPVVQLTLDHFQADLVEYADQEVVDVVVDAHRHLDELGPVRAGQAFPVCNAQSRKSTIINFLDMSKKSFQSSTTPCSLGVYGDLDLLGLPGSVKTFPLGIYAVWVIFVSLSLYHCDFRTMILPTEIKTFPPVCL